MNTVSNKNISTRVHTEREEWSSGDLGLTTFPLRTEDYVDLQLT